MNEQRFYNNLFELSLKYPSAVLKFLKSELQLGKKYIVIDAHTHNGQITHLLKDHVHLVCSLTSDPGYHNYLKKNFKKVPNFLSLNATPELINIEDDSIDCICIDETFSKFDSLRMGIEFERILRLNSYVLLLLNQLHASEESFTKFFEQILVQHNLKTQTSHSEIKPKLIEFFINGYQQQTFKYRQSFNWQKLEEFFLTILESKNLKPNLNSIKDLKFYFDKHEVGGQIHIEYNTILYYGLFNHSTPEISLRKSFFFQVLRPFAFGFYVLVKGNIYFWRALYKIKDKIFRKKKS
ncbi:MAG: hypothetical protein MK207_04930 [Saprospiraceae bacterium]|nr:hypothetical protein [Saprospiraceae bacterium]